MSVALADAPGISLMPSNSMLSRNALWCWYIVFDWNFRFTGEPIRMVGICPPPFALSSTEDSSQVYISTELLNAELFINGPTLVWIQESIWDNLSVSVQFDASCGQSCPSLAKSGTIIA